MKYFYKLLMAFCFAGLVSCNNDSNEVDSTPSVTEKDITDEIINSYITAENDNTTFGVYSGVLLGSEGNYKLVVREKGSYAKMIFDGKTYLLLTDETVTKGKALDITLKGKTEDDQDITLSIKSNADGKTPEVEITFPEHDIVVLSEKSSVEEKVISYIMENMIEFESETSIPQLYGIEYAALTLKIKGEEGVFSGIVRTICSKDAYSSDSDYCSTLEGKVGIIIGSVENYTPERVRLNIKEVRYRLSKTSEWETQKAGEGGLVKWTEYYKEQEDWYYKQPDSYYDSGFYVKKIDKFTVIQ